MSDVDAIARGRKAKIGGPNVGKNGRLLCDVCGWTVSRGDDHCTDARVCGTTDGPGFALCSRKKCVQRREHVEYPGGVTYTMSGLAVGQSTKEDGDLEALRRLYTESRKRYATPAKRGRPKTTGSSSTKLVSFRLSEGAMVLLERAAERKGTTPNLFARHAALYAVGAVDEAIQVSFRLSEGAMVLLERAAERKGTTPNLFARHAALYAVGAVDEAIQVALSKKSK
jgi:uncharacterized protein (DUF1778 family)